MVTQKYLLLLLMEATTDKSSDKNKKIMRSMLHIIDYQRIEDGKSVNRHRVLVLQTTDMQVEESDLALMKV